MIWLLLAGLILVICFGGVLIYGAPYLPTLRPQLNLALDFAKLKPGEILLELGSGDGRVLLAAAKRGYKVVGIEINPILFLVSKIVTWRYRELVEVRFGDFFRVEWPNPRAIFVFGLDRVMTRLDKKIKRSGRLPIRLISFGFRVQGRATTVTDNGVFVYDYD
jgi:SAM-dependent methyltransferase